MHSVPLLSLSSQAMSLSFTTPPTATRHLNPRGKVDIDVSIPASTPFLSLDYSHHHPKALYFSLMGTLLTCPPFLCGEVSMWSETYGI